MKVETNGKGTMTPAAATEREAKVDGFCPLAKSNVTVTAVYRDNIKTESSVEFSSEGVCVL